jgi:competence protein ComEC
VEAGLERQRAQLPPWIAVGLGLGVAGWFFLSSPAQWSALLCLASGASLAGFAIVPGRLGRAAGWFAAAMVLGCTITWLRANQVSAPRLERPLVTTVTGRVERIDHLSARGQVRLTVAADAPLPPRVRVSIDDRLAPPHLGKGARVVVRARLAPPPPMTLPGTHDFARDFWFQGIGATGKALDPPTISGPAQPDAFERARNRLRSHIGQAMATAPAGIAVALATGDQNAVGEDDAEAMRRSGLTHLLSVSGLHIAAVVGAAMLLTLRLLALSPWLALRFNLILFAAAAGAAAGIAYTLLTGSQVPTVRSCIAALLVLAGVALGRDALSLRLIATGAIAVLLIRPEALAGASFQMSFAAVTAIVALHSAGWARRLFQRREEGIAQRLARGLGAMVATGLVVEAALIPFALYHFHRAGLYGVAANLLAIPLTTFVIMPAEAAALLFDVAGIGAPFWWLAEQAIRLLLEVAHAVGTARGAVVMLPAMPAWCFAAMIGGGLWLCLWEGRVRLWGLPAFTVGAAGAWLTPAPDLLVTGDGRHLAIVQPGSAPLILRQRSGDFVRSALAESAAFDGEPEALDEAVWSDCNRDSCVTLLRPVKDGRTWRLLATRSAQRIDWSALVQACAAADIVISDRWLPDACAPQWLKLDRAMLQRTGGMALYLAGPTPRIDTVSRRIGAHPWAQRLAPLRQAINTRQLPSQ